MARAAQLSMIAIACALACSAKAADYAIGADLSFLKQAEDKGTQFKLEGKTEPGLQIFKEHGCNWIRLRLFHTPADLPNNLEYTIALRENLIFMAHQYKKPIVVVETAYNWTPGEYTKRPGPFPESPDGQKEFPAEVNRAVQETPDGLGA